MTDDPIHIPMNTHRWKPALLALIALSSLNGALCAQQINLQESQTEAIKLMQHRKWEDALKLNQAAVKQHGQGALEQWGPWFGSVYFRKGYCELMLGQHEAAMKSFETCHKDFPNQPGASNENEFEIRALRHWANAAMGKEDWQLALNLLSQFVENCEPKRDRYNRGQLVLDMANCHYNLGEIEKGNECFQHLLDHR